jgi:hypothetical protein
MKTEKMNLWQRCEQIGPMEDQGVSLYRTDSGDYRIFIDRATVFHVHQDGTIGDYCRAWLGEAIVQRFEAITGKDSFPLPVPVKLPDVTYVVEAPKPTEPTQDQLKALYETMMSDTNNIERIGINGASTVVGDGVEVTLDDGRYTLANQVLVSIPVTRTIQSILFPEIKDVEFES